MLLFNLIPLASKVRLATLALLGAAAAIAPAGHYDVTYSGGKTVSIDEDNNRTETPYGPLSDGFYGGGGATGKKVGRLWITGPGTVECSGAITVTLTWNNGGNPNDKPPKSVVLSESGHASWGGDSGSCADGLGHSQVTDPYSGLSEGPRYQVKSGGPTITYTVNPAASGTYGSSSSAPIIAGGAYVSYKVTPTPVVLALEGTIQHDGLDKILIGQNIKAKLQAGSFALYFHQWSMTTNAADIFQGEVFLDRTPSDRWPGKEVIRQHLYSMADYGSPWFNESELSYFYGKPSGDGEADKVSCAATASLVGQFPIGNVEAEKELAVKAPTFEFDAKPIALVNFAANEYVGGHINPSRVNSGGIAMSGRVTTPPEFLSQGTGRWNVTQTARLDRKIFAYYPGVGSHTTTDGRFWLDNVFPYDGHWPADGNPHGGTDAPGMTLAVSVYKFEISDEYRAFQVYEPPSNNGAAVAWVPLEYELWTWTAYGENGSGGWTNPATGGTVQTDEVKFPLYQFQWGNVIINTDPDAH